MAEEIGKRASDAKVGSEATEPKVENRDWYSSEAGRSRILQLLRNAGTPLELRIASQCREFCRKHDRENETRITTIRAIYDDSQSDKASREVDQSVQFDREIDLNDKISVRLRLRIPIECKCREGIEVFGFPRPKADRLASLPMLSDFAGATLLNQLAYTEPRAILRAGNQRSLLSKRIGASCTMSNSFTNLAVHYTTSFGRLSARHETASR